MPSGAVKAVVLVSDLDEVLGFLELAGVAPVERFESTGEQAAIGLGWPVEHGATTARSSAPGRASSSWSRSRRRSAIR